jgi:hypothetical protein
MRNEERTHILMVGSSAEATQLLLSPLLQRLIGNRQEFESRTMSETLQDGENSNTSSGSSVTWYSRMHGMWRPNRNGLTDRGRGGGSGGGRGGGRGGGSKLEWLAAKPKDRPEVSAEEGRSRPPPAESSAGPAVKVTVATVATVATVTVTTPSGEVLEMDLPTSATVATVKRRVELDTGLLPTQLQLFLVAPTRASDLSPVEMEESEQELRDWEVLWKVWRRRYKQCQSLSPSQEDAAGKGGDAKGVDAGSNQEPQAWISTEQPRLIQLVMVVVPWETPATASSFGS